MDGSLPLTLAADVVREDFIPKVHYVSAEVAALEKTRLWQRTWQMACREEELERVGSYVVYDIADQSIIVVRTGEDEISAFHNVCPHRGNQLLSGCGAAMRFYCSFHGWQWSIDGQNTYMKDAEDWAGCASMTSGDMSLTSVRVGRWGGFVFVNMDLNGETFEDFIDPVPHYLNCVQFDRMRLSWYKTVKLNGNWKTAIESFMESYHVFSTHGQLVPFFDEISVSTVHGKHGKHGYPNARPLGAPSARTGKPVPEDLRANYIRVLEDLVDQTGAGQPPNVVGNVSARAAEAVKRLMIETPANAAPMEVLMTGLRFMQEAAEADGAGWPEISPEQFGGLGVDWSLFPNMVLVFGLDASLVFRSRPDGDDPDHCIFDMWGILRTAPDRPPTFERETFEDWRAHIKDIPSLLIQDLANIEKIQRGMHSIAFKGSRTNPVQESQIFNFHRVLDDYLARP